MGLEQQITKATGGRMKLDRSTENLLAFIASGSKSVPDSATGAAQGDAWPEEKKSSWWLGESLVLQLRRDMLRYCERDVRHAGIYKFGPNRVEAKNAAGEVAGIVFDPTPPHLVQKEMQELMDWYGQATNENFRHPLIVAANFVFEYLAIHPFQDGNGRRTSRLLTNLILLRGGYEFAEVVSHEKLVENRKADYYLALNRTQRTWKTEQEDISAWLVFFLEIIRHQSREALEIL